MRARYGQRTQGRFGRLIAAAVAPLALLLIAAPAQADFGVGLTTPSTAGSTTQAGAATDFTTDVTFSGTDDVKTLVFHLPPGVVGNPNVTPLCSQATFTSGTCPADTQVGTTTVTASAGGAPATDAQGNVYNLEPNPGEPARLGVDVDPSPFGIPLLPHIKLQVSASLRPADGGLDATADNIPNSLMGGLVSLHVTRQVLTLQGHPPAASGTFFSNPTGCPNPAATTNVTATSYSSTVANASAPYPVTGCDQLPFAPKMYAVADVSGGSAPGTHIGLSTLITQAPGEANPKKVVVTLPASIKADPDAIGRTCSPANLNAHTCPATSRIGTAAAITPLLSQPVSGPVYVTATSQGLLGFTAQMSGQVDLVLNGYANTPNNIIVSTFDGVPDVPISFFALSFDSGPNGSLLAATDLCSAPPQTLQANFLAHSGATATQTPTMGVTGCPAKPSTGPQATVSAKGLAGPRPTVAVHILAGGPDLTGATVKLPGTLTLRRGHGVVKAGSTKRVKAKLGAHTVKLTGVPSGTRRLDLTLAKGAVTSSRSLQRKLKHQSKTKLSFQIKVTQKGAAAVTLKVTAKGKR